MGMTATIESTDFESAVLNPDLQLRCLSEAALKHLVQELNTRAWSEHKLLRLAYAFEQATHPRKPPVLVKQGLLPIYNR